MNFIKVKSGFTLMELMVYIALLGVIVLIAGQAFSDSSRMRVRTQSLLQASETAGNVASIIKQDIAQLGAKSYKDAATGHIVIHDSVYMSPINNDYSSYYIGNGGEAQQDTLIMRRIRYNNSGSYEAVEEVKWLVDENSFLKRFCRTIVGTGNDECSTAGDSVVMTDYAVSKFKFTAATPSTMESAASVLPTTNNADNQFKLVSRYGDEKFERLEVAHSSDYTTETLSGFVANYDFESDDFISNPDLIKANQVFMASENLEDESGSWQSQCKSVNLNPFVEYEISFNMPLPSDMDDNPTGMFCPGRDHMTVGFRFVEDGARVNSELDTLPEFQFYPPTSDDPTDTGFRKMRFTTNKTLENVCLCFTFAFFSPIASSGSVVISNLKLKVIPSSNYKFTDDDIAIGDKKNVKAIKMEFSIKKNDEAGEETAIISIPSNGPRD